MNRKRFNLRVSSVKGYVRAFSGFIGDLTPKEIEILTYFVQAHLNIKRKSIPISPFSTGVRKQIADKAGLDLASSLNGYIKKLVDKGALKKVGEDYKIHPVVIPEREDEVVIQIIAIKQTKSENVLTGEGS